jgi:hypothetical protein
MFTACIVHDWGESAGKQNLKVPATSFVSVTELRISVELLYYLCLCALSTLYVSHAYLDSWDLRSSDMYMDI